MWIAPLDSNIFIISPNLFFIRRFIVTHKKKGQTIRNRKHVKNNEKMIFFIISISKTNEISIEMLVKIRKAL